MPDTVTRFLERRETLLARLELQLHQAGDAAEAARIACEFTGRELNLADCAFHLPGESGLQQAASWGTLRDPSRPQAQATAASPDIATECARTLRTQRIDDLSAQAVAAPPGVLSALAVAVSQDGILLGVIDSEAADAGFYDARYEQAFEAIAAQAAPHLRRPGRGHRR